MPVFRHHCGERSELHVHRGQPRTADGNGALHRELRAGRVRERVGRGRDGSPLQPSEQAAPGEHLPPKTGSANGPHRHPLCGAGPPGPPPAQPHFTAGLHVRHPLAAAPHQPVEHDAAVLHGRAHRGAQVRVPRGPLDRTGGHDRTAGARVKKRGLRRNARECAGSDARLWV
eukprot:996975-Prorocentrum_minimum.AAC.1